jgi:hypothetical protein
MTAPQAKATTPTPRSTRKRDPKNVEQLAGAKKVADALPAPEKATATKAAAKAPAKTPVKQDAPAERAPRTVNKVGPLPKPVKLSWAEKDGKYSAESGRYRYRITEGDDGGWFAATATGKWVPLLSRCDTLDVAKQVCEIDAAGAHWMAWTKFNGVALARLVEQYGWAK